MENILAPVRTQKIKPPHPMALILQGRSSCSLCGNRLLDGEPITALSAIADQTHPLLDYFDSGFHRACFEAWQHRDEAL